MATYAVIDLGSNTFHLLIAEFSEGHLRPVIKKRFFTKLSDGGVNFIKPERYSAGLDAVKQFADILHKFGQPPLSVMGTAVLRQASNRKEFVYEVETILNAPVNIIDGHQEADYIYKGVTLLDGMKTGSHLIMDIGGGSTEFILVRENEKIWSQSYALGVGLLHSMFDVSDPMTNSQYKDIREHITQTIADLKDVVAANPVQSLTGASGSFEILQSMTDRSTDNPGLDAIGTEELKHVFLNIFGKTTKELLSFQGLPPERAKLALTGLTLMSTVCDELNISLIQVSPFALKEGVIREMAEWESLTVEEIIQRNKGTIIDVRSYAEYQGGHVAGSVLIAYPELEKQLDRLKFLKPPLIIVCSSGNRSRQAVDKLKHLGVNCIDGGSWTYINYLKSLHNSD